MEQPLKILLGLLSQKDGIDYLDPHISPYNIPLSIIPLLKCENKKGAVEHLLQDMIKDYNPKYNHDEYDKIFTTAIDYLDILEKKNTVTTNIKSVRKTLSTIDIDTSKKLKAE